MIVDVVAVVPLVPRGKDRQRAVVRHLAGGQAVAGTFKPKKLEAWEGACAFALEQLLPGLPPLEGPVRIDLLIVLPRPKKLLDRWAKGRPEGFGEDRRWQYPTGLFPAEVKPDRDNVDKAALDSIARAGLFRTGDQQVVDGRLLKVYAEVDGRPRLAVRVRTFPTNLGEQAELVAVAVRELGFDRIALPPAPVEQEEPSSPPLRLRGDKVPPARIPEWSDPPRGKIEKAAARKASDLVGPADYGPGSSSDPGHVPPGGLPWQAVRLGHGLFEDDVPGLDDVLEKTADLGPLFARRPL